MKIGELAAQAGVHVETIRYYQHLGLIPRPARLHGTVRRYGSDEIGRLRFIKPAQALGFSLEEVKLLLDLAVGEHCAETRGLPQQKLKLVGTKISDLLSMQAALQKLVRACGSGKSGRGCPIIETLSESDDVHARVCD
jgi:MerR family mercuric resistance operon transcriptional regulator